MRFPIRPNGFQKDNLFSERKGALGIIVACGNALQNWLCQAGGAIVRAVERRSNLSALPKLHFEEMEPRGLSFAARRLYRLGGASLAGRICAIAQVVELRSHPRKSHENSAIAEFGGA